MKKQILLSIILLTVFGIIIASGCGNDSGIVNSPAITNDNNTNDTPDSENGFLTIQIMWPQSGSEGSFVFSSGDSNTLTASMPYGTTRIEIKIREAIDEDINNALPNGKYTFNWSPDKTYDFHTLGPLPVVKVKVRAEAYNAADELLGEPIEKEIQIKAGNNLIDIGLGFEILELLANPPYISLNPVIPSRAGVGPPSPELSGETQIVARLYLESPDIPDQPVIVTPTPGGVEPKDIADIESQGAWGLENYEVKFTVLSGTGAELIPLGGTDPEAVVTAQTNPMGYCGATLRTNTAGTIIVKAECILDPNDPDSPVLSEVCEVQATVPSGEGSILYKMESDMADDWCIHIIPDYESPDGLALRLYEPLCLRLYKADLSTADPNSSFLNWEPGAYKTVNFEVIEGLSGDVVSPPSAVTDENGYCETQLWVPDDYLLDRDIKVRATFSWGGSPSEPAHTITYEWTVAVTTSPAISDDFEKYPLGTKATELIRYAPIEWQAGGDASGNYAINNLIVSDPSYGKAMQLYTSPITPYKASISTYVGHWDDGDMTKPFELRFLAKMGDETITADSFKRGSVAITGVYSEEVGGGGINYTPLIRSGEKYGTREILNCYGDVIGTYDYNEWIPVKIQYDPLCSGVQHYVKINYWIKGELVSEITIDNLIYLDSSHLLMFESYGGSVWYDEFKVYNLKD